MSEPIKPVLFGLNVDPSTSNLDEAYRRAHIADQNGLDLITIQDHAYNRQHLETWTLMTALAAATRHVHVGGNVLTLPLRPPAMLAKQAATLDVISNGRVELGLGAGAYPPGIDAFGGPDLSPAEQVRAFEEGLAIIRGLWRSSGRSFSYDGEFYQVQGVHFGPTPTRPIPIWVGAIGPQMQRLTGRLADGLLISNAYVPPRELPAANERLDEGAAKAGRSPEAVRRGYNLMGVLDLGGPDTKLDDPEEGHIVGGVQEWIEEIVRLHEEHRQDTFIFWPIAGDELQQVEVFAEEVVPAVGEILEAQKGDGTIA